MKCQLDQFNSELLGIFKEDNFNRIIYLAIYALFFSDLNLVQHKLREVLEKCPNSLQTVHVLKLPWLNLKNRCSPIKVKLNDSLSGQLRKEEKLVTLDFKNYGWRNLVLFLEGKYASQEF